MSLDRQGVDCLACGWTTSHARPAPTRRTASSDGGRLSPPAADRDRPFACAASRILWASLGDGGGAGGWGGGQLTGRPPVEPLCSAGVDTSSADVHAVSPRKQRPNRKGKKPAPPLRPANRQGPPSASNADLQADLRACAQVRAADTARARSRRASSRAFTAAAPAPAGRPRGRRPTRSSAAAAARRGPSAHRPPRSGSSPRAPAPPR